MTGGLLGLYVLPKSQIIWDLGRQNAQITSIWDLGFGISAKDTNYNLEFGIWDFGIWDFDIWILNLGGRYNLDICHSRLFTEPQNWCWHTGDLLGCLIPHYGMTGGLLGLYVLPKSQIIWDLGRQNAQITSIWDLGFGISAKDTNYNLEFGIWDFGIWDFDIWILNLGGRYNLDICHSRLFTEPQNWCWHTGDLLGCLIPH
ncbi:hypothetical protein Glove_131g61 [Diversispora epigaea]|uniref:Uncharacterized protein n=1 Tax=Diversispora epigaea TaxID=1348612 RepID=A0A397IY58_9GLOM|nr:hypothetical protein Glove_131g61 [Diversispora epigaea]